MSGPDFVEHTSAWSFDTTLARIRQAISSAGMQVFAAIDHADNARQAGLAMPPATVLVYGKAEGGTPLMLQAPRCALDLPLHVLVREDQGQTLVGFHPIAAQMVAAGVPAALAERLAPAQALILKAIAP